MAIAPAPFSTTAVLATEPSDNICPAGFAPGTPTPAFISPKLFAKDMPSASPNTDATWSKLPCSAPSDIVTPVANMSMHLPSHLGEMHSTCQRKHPKH